MKGTLELYSAALNELEELLAVEFRIYALYLKKGGVNTGGAPTTNEQNRLVEYLQYHDIIRQKIEHVRLLLEKWAYGEEADSEKVYKSPQLLELSLALLRYTLLEYVEVRKKISQISQDPALSLPPLKAGSSFEGSIQKLIDMLEEEYLEMEDGSEEDAEAMSAERLGELVKTFSMQSERDVFALFFEDQSGQEKNLKNSEQEGQVDLF